MDYGDRCIVQVQGSNPEVKFDGTNFSGWEHEVLQYLAAFPGMLEALTGEQAINVYLPPGPARPLYRTLQSRRSSRHEIYLRFPVHSCHRCPHKEHDLQGNTTDRRVESSAARPRQCSREPTLEEVQIAQDHRRSKPYGGHRRVGKDSCNDGYDHALSPRQFQKLPSTAGIVDVLKGYPAYEIETRSMGGKRLLMREEIPSRVVTRYSDCLKRGKRRRQRGKR